MASSEEGRRGAREDGQDAVATGKKHGDHVPDLSRREIRTQSKPAVPRLEILCEGPPIEHISGPCFLLPWAGCHGKTCGFWCSQRSPYSVGEGRGNDRLKTVVIKVL
jgi:hypothetical protein